MPNDCPECDGSGQVVIDELEDGTEVLGDCEACGGSGEEDDTCPNCRGTGIGMFGDPDTSRCSACHGNGTIRRD